MITRYSMLLVLMFHRIAAVEVSVAPYKGDKAAAVSLTFDDAFDDHHQVVAPMLEQYGFRATFFVIIRHVEIFAGWEAWKPVAEKGHEIGNHTWNHPSLPKVKDVETLQREIVDSKAYIEEHIGHPVISFAYPFAKTNEEVSKLTLEHHEFARLYEPLYGGKDFKVETANQWVRDAIKKGSWHVGLLHSVSDSVGFKPLQKKTFEAHLKFLKQHEDQLWVDTYGNVGRYLRARDAAELNTKREGNRAEISVTFPEGVHPVLLTLKVKPEEKVTGAVVTVSGTPVESRMREGVILFDLTPGKTAVVEWE